MQISKVFQICLTQTVWFDSGALCSWHRQEAGSRKHIFPQIEIVSLYHVIKHGSEIYCCINLLFRGRSTLGVAL